MWCWCGNSGYRDDGRCGGGGGSVGCDVVWWWRCDCGGCGLVMVVAEVAVVWWCGCRVGGVVRWWKWWWRFCGVGGVVR